MKELKITKNNLLDNLISSKNEESFKALWNSNSLESISFKDLYFDECGSLKDGTETTRTVIEKAETLSEAVKDIIYNIENNKSFQFRSFKINFYYSRILNKLTLSKFEHDGKITNFHLFTFTIDSAEKVYELNSCFFDLLDEFLTLKINKLSELFLKKSTGEEVGVTRFKSMTAQNQIMDFYTDNQLKTSLIQILNKSKVLENKTVEDLQRLKSLMSEIIDESIDELR